ncbi:hypothetical protein TNIN_78711 [Trichonephila inaurata madagascariensis]|uniref:C2H2-type domain-containing protein n=1 Tax=Trichonephila inaurata madagascariensis TaxID=2747483 RepID=A0A8X6X4W6_9ARAC|nr:hypothetical protein TNIN_78711 [Trichonephila inaurata madagascariensis]
MAIHDENVNDPCPVCRKLWPSEHDLIRHLDVMHNEYFEANFEALNEMRIKEMQNMSLPYGKLCCDPELFDDNEVNHPVSLNDCSPPTDIKNKETQQMPGGINSSFFSATFTPSKRSESVRKHVSTALPDQDF